MKRHFTTPILLIAVIAMSFTYFIFQSPEGVEFEQLKWACTPAVRPAMAKRLVSTRALHGKNRKQIVSMLGQPESNDPVRNWDLVYYLGTGDSYFPIDAKFLAIEFNSAGVSVRVAIIED